MSDPAVPLAGINLGSTPGRPTLGHAAAVLDTAGRT
jgi:hypothetical protein